MSKLCLSATSACVMLLGVAVYWAASADKAPEVKVSAVGLNVFRPGLDSVFTHATPQRKSGTIVTLKVSSSAKNFAGIDEDSCKLTAFKDDKGNDLTAKLKTDAMAQWLGYPVTISDDSHECLIDIQSPNVPGDGAGSLKIQGSLEMLCGSQEKTVTNKAVALKAGKKLAVDTLSVLISNVQDMNSDEVRTVVTLGCRGSEDRIKSVVFQDDAGKEIPFSIVGKSFSEFSGTGSFDILYGLSKRVESATIVITYYDKIEKLTVPISLTVSLGL